MSVVIWRPARSEDRGALSVFVCTDPAKPYKSAASGWKPHHPRIFEYHVQQMIRGLSSKVPCRGAQKVHVAVDEEGIAGVVCWTELEGPSDVHIDVVGLAMRYRRQQGGLAREIADVVLREIEAAAIEAGAEELYVEADIFRLNDASQALAADKQFTKLSEAPTGAQTWSIRVPLAGAELDEQQDT